MDVSPPVYRGHFGRAQAERLLWRAGFGPRPGEADRLAKLGMRKAVLSLTRPGRERFVGLPPTDDQGRPLSPNDAYAHDQLWWLDRMVRTNRPLVERMTLVWHDWFATSMNGVGSQRLMVNQNQLLRHHWLGSFKSLLLGVTSDPAMLQWLNGSQSRKGRPNENYARELMELFTLGAGRGYSERDIREQARALTGWWGVKDLGPRSYRFRPEYHDTGKKRIFGKTGAFDWRDSCVMCLRHRSHPSFFVRKLWSYFVPEGPPRSTQGALERIYRRDFQVRPVVEAILMHPDLYTGPRMVKPPIVFTAGLLRARMSRIDTRDWASYTGRAGQTLFRPPSVAGWNDERWLDTGTLLGRWDIVRYIAAGGYASVKDARASESPEKLLQRALLFWGKPTLTAGSRDALLQFARRGIATARAAGDRRDTYAGMVENSLRHLIGLSPDLQAS